MSKIKTKFRSIHISEDISTITRGINMALVVSNVGEIQLMTWALKGTSVTENIILRLYTNNYTPVAASTSANFTECAIAGYSAKTLSRASWSTPTTNVYGKAEMSYAVQTFSFTASGTIYGYYVVTASNVLLWAEMFSSARSVNSGDSLAVTPKLVGSSEN